MNKKVVIIGAGDLGRQFLHLITNYTEDSVIGWYDDTLEKGIIIEGVEVKGSITDIELDREFYDEVAIAIGYKHLPLKQKLVNKLIKRNLRLYTFIHPTSCIDISAKIGYGCFIYSNCTIDSNVLVEPGVLINNAAVVSHDSKIGSCSFIAPGVCLSGFVQIKNCCFIGSGSIISDSVSICDSVILGSGSLVIKDIKLRGEYVGGPKLRKLK